MAKRYVRDDEATLWRTVMRDVVPLHKSSIRPEVSSHRCRGSLESPAEKTQHKKKTVQPEALQALKRRVAAPPHPSKRPHQLAVGVRAPGLDNTQWKKLSRGQMRVDARLDLHGYFVQDAFDALLHFMHRARGMHWRCVEIVTGLGSGQRGGTIRRELPLWLQRNDLRPMILAVVHSHHGNQGAVRVLLKKVR